MRERYGAVRLALFSICVAACAAQAPGVDDAPGEPQGESASEHDLAAIAGEGARAVVGTTAPSSDEGDLDLQTPQASIFGVGTSCSPRNPCLNGGTCVDQWLGYSCICQGGFTGSQCQTAGASCGGLAPPNNGRVSTPRGTGIDAIATYACDTGFVLSGAATRFCQLGGWSGSAPTCVKTGSCGNGRRDAGEACDPSVGDSPWTCNTDCTRKTSYNACTATSCANGEVCFAGFCTKACQASTSNCPQTPANSGSKRMCLRERNETAYDICAAVECRTRADCAPGLGCFHLSDGFSYCVQCAGVTTGTCN